MSTLTFPDTHNMVAFLEKPAESNGFHEIIDFLNANQIHYALTVNPTIYTSCIEQFWATAKGRSKIKAIDRDVEVTLVETQRRNDENDDNLMFDTGVFYSDEIVVETEVPVSTDEIDLAQEITLAQALAAMKSAKPKEKDVQRAKRIAFREPVKSTVTTIVPSQKSKDKGKAIMIKPKNPLKKKDQIELDEELARETEAEKIFEKHMKWINSFVPMEEDLPSEGKKESRRRFIELKNLSKGNDVEDDNEEVVFKKCFDLAKEKKWTMSMLPLASTIRVQ
ncbi:hypothetical protein Tco_0039570 [Tanacetum coccineum]